MLNYSESHSHLKTHQMIFGFGVWLLFLRSELYQFEASGVIVSDPMNEKKTTTAEHTHKFIG